MIMIFLYGFFVNLTFWHKFTTLYWKIQNFNIRYFKTLIHPLTSHRPHKMMRWARFGPWASGLTSVQLQAAELVTVDRPDFESVSKVQKKADVISVPGNIKKKEHKNHENIPGWKMKWKSQGDGGASGADSTFFFLLCWDFSLSSNVLWWH